MKLFFSLPNLKDEHSKRDVVILVNLFNCIAYDWTVRDDEMTLKGLMLSVSVSPKYFLKGYNKRLIFIGIFPGSKKDEKVPNSKI